MKQENKEKLYIGLFLISAALFGMLLVLWLNNRFIEKNKIQTESQNLGETKIQNEILSVYPDYDYYNNLPKLELASNSPSWVKEIDNKQEIKGRIIKRFIKVNGEIENAYLFIDVSVDKGKQLKIWDSVYVSLQKIINGYKYLPVLDGHIYKNSSLNIPPAGSSRYLFDLRQLPVINKRSDINEPIYSESRGINYLNWLATLKEAKEFELNTFLSSSREGGMINNISIGYQCSEQTPNCKLELTK